MSHAVVPVSGGSRGPVVVDYTDRATGTMRVEPAGHGVFTAVVLRPRVQLCGELAPGPELDAQLAEVCGQAHEHCFIARSVTFSMLVELAAAAVAG